MSITFSITRKVTCLAYETASYTITEHELNKRLDAGMTKEEAFEDAIVCDVVEWEDTITNVDEILMEHEKSFDW